MVFVPSVYVVN